MLKIEKTVLPSPEQWEIIIEGMRNPIALKDEEPLVPQLDEWHVFCDWIKTLPYSELITGGDKDA